MILSLASYEGFQRYEVFMTRGVSYRWIGTHNTVYYNNLVNEKGKG